MTAMPLSDQVILITGAGGGLGGSAALALAKNGAIVILLDNKIKKIEAVYDRIKSANSNLEPILYPFDLAGANENEYQELADNIQAKYGRLDGLLHSAVEFTGLTPIITETTKNWAHTLNVNLNAAFLLTRTVLPLLQKSHSASMIFTSDSFARHPAAYTGAYGVSKIALEGFAKILAEELESFKKIRVNIFIPGPIDSPLRNQSHPAEDKTKLPAIRSLDEVYVYLFGQQSTGVTGQTIDARTFHL
jgi:NAD(P)-dependent dehydrogenase (short-subunit alcohol dehydrogenase family)